MIFANNNLKAIFGVLFLFTMLAGCNKKIAPNHTYFDKEFTGGHNLVFDSIELDSLQLEHISSSYSGNLAIRQDFILFFDQYFARFFLFNTNGELQQEYMGIGPGPEEIPVGNIRFFAPRADGSFVLFGSSYDFYEISPHFERVHTSMLRWQQNRPLEYLQTNPTPEDQRSYNLGYGIGQIRATENVAWLPLISPPPPYSEFNLNTDLFAAEARILAKMNLETGVVEDILGRYSPVYWENEDAGIFSFFSFSLLPENTMAITYRADSLIYVFDMDFAIQEVFGYAGRDMDTEYQGFPDTPNESSLGTHWQQEEANRGYYTALEYIEERDLLFRSYQKGGGIATDGLQIYRGTTLLADVDVPKTFKIAGYSEPWFYSNPFIDEVEETITIFRFQLQE